MIVNGSGAAVLLRGWPWDCVDQCGWSWLEFNILGLNYIRVDLLTNLGEESPDASRARTIVQQNPRHSNLTLTSEPGHPVNTQYDHNLPNLFQCQVSFSEYSQMWPVLLEVGSVWLCQTFANNCSHFWTFAYKSAHTWRHVGTCKEEWTTEQTDSLFCLYCHRLVA